jgi:hypothetical protein
VDGRRRVVTLKRVTLRFDVAANNVTGSFLTDLAVRIRRAGFWDPEGSPLPELGFHLSCGHLLRANTAVPDPASGWWVDAPLPMPLVFVPTDASGPPQPGVRAVGSRPATEPGATPDRGGFGD